MILTENKKFTDWWMNLKPFEKRYFIRKLALECDVHVATIYRWVEGETELKRAFKLAINSAVHQNIFDVSLDNNTL